METSFHLLFLPLQILFLFLCPYPSTSQLETKSNQQWANVSMQSPPFGILGINNNPHHTSTPLQNQDKGKDNSNSCLFQSWTLPIGLADAEERRSRRTRRTKTKYWRRQEKQSLHRRQPAPSHCPNESEQTLPSRVNDIGNDNDIFVDTSWTPQDEAESEGEEGTVVAAPATKKRRASNTYFPGCWGTLLFSPLHHQYPKDLPQGTTLLIKEWLPQTAKKKDTGEGFKTYDLWMWMEVSGMMCQSSPFGESK